MAVRSLATLPQAAADPRFQLWPIRRRAGLDCPHVPDRMPASFSLIAGKLGAVDTDGFRSHVISAVMQTWRSEAATWQLGATTGI